LRTLVADGIYKGAGNKDLNFFGKAIIVLSENGPESTKIECEGSGRGFYFGNHEGSDSVLEGFSINNGSTTGITCTDRSSPIITNCIIADFHDDSWGGGIYCSLGASPIIDNCIISGNYAEIAGGGIYIYSSTPIIKNTDIIDNGSWDFGGGIYCAYCSPSISNCIIQGNGVDGIFMEYSSPSITNCVIKDNHSYDWGGGITCFNSSSIVTNCIISENWNNWEGSGIYAFESFPMLNNCTFSKNVAEIGGGIYSFNSLISVNNCILWNNSPDAIYVYSGDDPIVTYSDIEKGWEGEGNIDEDPLFYPFPIRGFEFLLRPNSPCIDSGDPEIEDRLYDWYKRWPKWYPDDARSDMGAYGGPGNWRWLK
jgi:parallel beta-helix repeat protein